MKSLLVLFGFWASAAHADYEALIDGSTLAKTDVRTMVTAIAPGTVVILSEVHDSIPHHQHQVEFLNELGRQFEAVSVGMEFFPRTRQDKVDQFLEDKLTEAEFLEQVEWGQNPFSHYRVQVFFPTFHGGKTLALNAPRFLTTKIAKQGLDSLSEEEKALLPDGFTLGNKDYEERFREVMSDHIPPEKIPNYFAAQSTWDETMADTACRYMTANPKQILVIIVGDFHAIYGGGLPDRLKARGCANVKIISQIEVEDLSEPAHHPEIMPHPRWGPRADFIWANENKEAAPLGTASFFKRLML